MKVYIILLRRDHKRRVRGEKGRAVGEDKAKKTYKELSIQESSFFVLIFALLITNSI
jgi:hypothetical protein